MGRVLEARERYFNNQTSENFEKSIPDGVLMIWQVKNNNKI
jgi:hypothetical protein